MTESTCWRSPGLHTPRFIRCIVSYCTDALSSLKPAGVIVVRKEHDGSYQLPLFRSVHAIVHADVPLGTHRRVRDERSEERKPGR